MRERERIATYFAPLSMGEPGSFSLRDDAAALTPPPGAQLVLTTDSVIEGIHVLPGATPAQFAQKALRRNLSDLAAMGAQPWRYLLNLHTPPGLADDWFAAFAAALAEEQQHFTIVLAGGDSTSAHGAIHITITCIGLLRHAALQRSGAAAGDDLYVSGTIGDAALGLTLLQQNSAAKNTLTARYHLPQPRLALGLALHGIASSAMDISDGLLQDIAQLCAASGVGVTLHRDAIPRSEAAETLLRSDDALWAVILSGGDDYELLFTARPTARPQVEALAETLGLALTRIGTMTTARRVELLDAQGAPLPTHPDSGWEYR